MNGFPNQNGQPQQQMPQFDQNTMNQIQQERRLCYGDLITD